MLKSFLKFTLGAALGIALMGSVASLKAQSTFGTLLGTVKDSSGAVVPGAKVIITNTDEGTSQTITTNAQGNYELVDVKPSHYSVTVSETGFKTDVHL